MNPDLEALKELQTLDTRIAGLEGEAARLPGRIEAIQAALAAARREVETLKGRVETTRKDLRMKEKDLEVVAAKRAKAESRLYEVKTNKEYSAVLVEIEDIKQEKARTEEEILSLMELGERLGVEIREAEARLRARETEAQQDEAAVRRKLAEVENELGIVRAQRASRTRELPRPILADYEKILRARGGLAVTSVGPTAVCGGCRMSVRPQALQEIRAGAALVHCESCGRYLYWQE